MQELANNGLASQNKSRQNFAMNSNTNNNASYCDAIKSKGQLFNEDVMGVPANNVAKIKQGGSSAALEGGVTGS